MGVENVSMLDCFRPCRGLRVLGSAMVLLVLGSEAFVCYVVIFCYSSALRSGDVLQRLSVASLIATLIFLGAMSLWSYERAVLTDPGRVPRGWHPFASSAISTCQLRSKFAGGGVFAGRMDHYCVWIVNCVGLLNYKFFLLFLGYTLLASIGAFLALLPHAFHSLARPREDQGGRSAAIVLIATILTFSFGLALLLFVPMQVHMVLHNYTSIESIEHVASQAWPHDRGLKKNVEEVLGRRRKLWWMPVLSDDDVQWLVLQSIEPHQQTSEISRLV